MNRYEPTDLERMFREIEGVPYVTESQEVEKITKTIALRARAIITYALGACQLPNIRQLLQPLEAFAVHQANEIIEPDLLLMQIAEDEVLNPQVLPHLQALEEKMHQSRQRDSHVQKKTIRELVNDLAQRKNVA